MDLRAPATEIAEPGLYDLTAAAYHADPCLIPSLNSGTAQRLCAETPRHAMAVHPRISPFEEDKDDSTEAMRVGSVVHELLLGKGGGMEIIDAADWRSKAAKEARAAAIEAGKTPILKEQFQRARLIADIAEQTISDTAGCENALTEGASEVVGIWQEQNGAWCRFMMDRLMTDLSVVYDLKTTGIDLSDHSLSRKISSGLDLQAAFYLRGLWTICPEMAERTKWRWVFVETSPPYEIRVIEADAETISFGMRKAAFAIDAWRRCMESGRWPGYPRTVERVEYAAWAGAAWLERELVAAEAGRDPLAMIGKPVAERDGELMGPC